MSVGLATRTKVPAASIENATWAPPDPERIPPVVDRLGILRLATFAPADFVAIVPADPVEEPSRLRPDGTLAQPWARLHSLIQDELQGLWDRTRQARPGLLTRSGLVSTRGFPIFSYRAFYRRALDEEDPIIAGVEVWLKPDGYKILGEICGEESGESHYDEEADSSRDLDELQRVAGAVARRLAGQAKAVVAALEEA